MIYYNINNINVNDENTFVKMVHKIRNIIIQNKGDVDKVLVISVQEIISNDSNMIPKLEYKKV
jgi:hypothetical protein